MTPRFLDFDREQFVWVPVDSPTRAPLWPHVRPHSFSGHLALGYVDLWTTHPAHKGRGGLALHESVPAPWGQLAGHDVFSFSVDGPVQEIGVAKQGLERPVLARRVLVRYRAASGVLATIYEWATHRLPHPYRHGRLTLVPAHGGGWRNESWIGEPPYAPHLAASTPERAGAVQWLAAAHPVERLNVAWSGLSSTPTVMRWHLSPFGVNPARSYRRTASLLLIQPREEH